MGRFPLSVLACILLSAGIASGQCYVFSSGSAASLSVNITSLPAPAMPVKGTYQYTSDAGLAGTATLTIGQTKYSSGPLPVFAITNLSDTGLNFSDLEISLGFSLPNFSSAGAAISASWNAILFPSGHLPASLPSFSGSQRPILVATVISSSGVLVNQTYTLTSVSGCSTTTTPPVTTPPVTNPPVTPPPPPALTSISPAVPTVSSGAQTVTILGSQFQGGLTATLVVPGGTTFFLNGGEIQGVSASTFQASLALTSPGTFAIRVKNPDGQQSNTLSFSVVAAASPPISTGPTQPVGPPQPTIDQSRPVLNSASFARGSVAPGSLASIFGKNLATSNAIADSIPLPTSLAGVSVTINGNAVPVSGVFHDPVNGDQINIQIPLGTPSLSTAQLVVTRDGVSSPPQSVAIAATAPGIFAVQLLAGKIVGSGAGQAIAYGNADGEIAAQGGTIIGLTTRPAKINDQSTLVILATGLGAVDAAVKNGDVPSALIANTLTKPTVTIGGVPAQVVFSGLVGRDASGKALGFVGVYQINVIVAPGTPVGSAVPVQVSANGTVSRSDVTLAISQ